MSLKTTQFSPARHGFHFSNRFIDQTFSITFPSLKIPGLPPFPGKTVTKEFGGRCAGMSYAALDYYWNISSVPTHTQSDFGSGNVVPNLSNGLGQYIDNRHRTWNSPDPSADEKTARIILLPREDLLGPPIPEHEPTLSEPFPPLYKPVVAKGSYNFTLSELNGIRSQIDQGNPVPINLVADQTIDSVSGGNHAVVAYGYDESSNDLYVYDCNYPDVICYIRANDGVRSFDTYIRDNGGWTMKKTWKGYFRKDYSRIVPPYFDLTIKESIKCKDSSGNIINRIVPGEKVTAQYKVVNSGQYTARLRHYYFSVLKVNNEGDENGVNEDGHIGVRDTDTNPGNDITLAPGQEYIVSKISTVFSLEGIYRIAASFKTIQEEWTWGFHTQQNESSKIWLRVIHIDFTWVTAALSPIGQMEIFGRGSDNGIYHKWQQAGGVWHSPDTLGGGITDNCLAAANFSNGNLLITHRGMDKKLYYRVLASGGWDMGWNCLEGDLSGSPILMLTRPQGKIRIIASFNDGSLRFRDETIGGWTNWAPL